MTTGIAIALIGVPLGILLLTLILYLVLDRQEASAQTSKPDKEEAS